MELMKNYLLVALLAISVVANGEEKGNYASLLMDSSSEQIIGTEQLRFASKPAYPRICRATDGTYLLAWQETIPGRSDDNGRYIRYATSSDLRTWTERGDLFINKQVENVFGILSDRWYSCPEFLLLSDGTLMAVCCFWNLSTYSRIEGRADNGLAIRFSHDNGLTWTDETEIFHGQCWEPFLIQQRDGRIQCYFSEARAWISSSNSGTSMVESSDGGLIWNPDLNSRPYRVMRKKYWNPTWERYQYTDQMPTGVILDDSGKMAFAMEDCEMGNYSLGIVYSPNDGKWDYLQGAQVGPLERIDNLSINATGPYMVKFHTGEVLVTFTRNKGLEWPLLYRIGDAQAKNFGPEQKAFDRGGWSSAFVDTDNTVILVAPFKGGKIHIARFSLVK